MSALAVTDEIEEWLEQRGLWQEISSEIMAGYIPEKVQWELRTRLALSQDCTSLLSRLLADSNGIPLARFGVEPDQWEEILLSGDCACAQLVHHGLARVQDSAILKPLKPAFSAGIQYLIGLTAAF